MRFVELQPTPNGGKVSLHPRITLLRGLDPASRVAVVGMAHDIALGETPEWAGTVEIDGVEHPLAEGVRLMGATADCALIIPAGSLPSPSPAPAPTPTDTESRAEADVGEADAEAKLSDVDDIIEGLAEELSASGRLRSEMNGRIEAATARIDISAGPRLDRTDGELGRAARLAGRPDPWTGMSDVDRRIEELEALSAELEEQLTALPSGDRILLAAAAATANASISTGSVVSPEAAALAQAWTSLHQRLLGLESRMEAAGVGTETVATRLEAARAAARAAEDAAVPRPVGPEEEAELERLHEEMLEAEGRTGRGMRRGSAKAAYERAAQALQDVLDPLGYPTWAAFRMGNGMVNVSAEAFAEYEQTKADLDAAETEWAELMARLERDAELQEVLQAIEQAFESVVVLIGEDPFGDKPDNDPEIVSDALMAFTIKADTVGVDPEAALAHLHAVLDDAGAIGHEKLSSRDAIIVLANSWLEVLEASDEAAVRIIRDQERAMTELAALGELGDGSRVDRLDDQRAAMYEAEIEVAETREALGEVVQGHLELHVLAATELAIAEDHDSRLVDREAARVLLELATQRQAPNGGVEDNLVSRVPYGAGGPIPVVIVMGNADASTLDVLTGLPDDIQIVVIGEGQGLDEWVERVGADVAASVDVSALV